MIVQINATEFFSIVSFLIAGAFWLAWELRGLRKDMEVVKRDIDGLGMVFGTKRAASRKKDL